MAGDTLKFRRAIETGANLADPHEALRLVGEIARAGRGAGQELPRPKRREHQYILARILLRAGEVAEAGRVLNGDAEMAIAPSDALIVDPGFARIGGHRYASNLLYREVIRDAGMSVTVVRSRGEIEGDATDSVGAFTPFAIGELFPGELGADEMNALNKLYLNEFRRVLPQSRPRLLVAHTVSRAFVEGLCGYLASAAPRSRSSVLLGVIEAGGGKGDRAKGGAASETYRRGFALLRGIPGLRLLIAVETPEIASFIGDDLPAEVVLVAPYIGARLATAGRSRLASPAPVVGFVGQSRKERGAHLIAGIARQTLAERPGRSLWRVQLQPERLADRFQPSLQADLADLAEGGRFTLLGVDLPTAAYHELLQSIDIMVMPYAGRYDASASGVAAECLRIGCVQVVPEGSSMARSAKEAGAGYVTFAERTTEAIAAAVVEALDRHEELAARSSAAADQLPGEDAYRRIVEFIRSA